MGTEAEEILLGRFLERVSDAVEAGNRKAARTGEFGHICPRRRDADQSYVHRGHGSGCPQVERHEEMASHMQKTATRKIGPRRKGAPEVRATECWKPGIRPRYCL